MSPYSKTSPVGSKPNLYGTQVPAVSTEDKGKEDGIVIHDDKKPALDTTPTVDVTATKEDFLDKLMKKSEKDRSDLKDLILGDEGERTKSKTTANQ